MSAELLPCPFCGSEAILSVERGLWKEHCSVKCSVAYPCRCAGAPCVPTWYETVELAIAAWNTRAVLREKEQGE